MAQPLRPEHVDPIGWRKRHHQVIVDHPDGTFQVRSEVYETPLLNPAYLVQERGVPWTIEFSARCRRCDNCLDHRRKIWGARGAREIQLSTRTWFVTFTLNAHTRFLYSIPGYDPRSDKAKKKKPKVKKLPQGISGQITASFQRFNKRLRASTKAPIRYFAVVEPHKDGTPHMHALIHEAGVNITERKLRATWHDGFLHAVLVDREDPKAPWYVAKYIGKEKHSRILASKKYGRLSE